MNKKFTVVIAFMVMLIVLGGCSNTRDLSLAEKIEAAFPDDLMYEEIYHIEVINKGVLVFYKSMDGLGTAFLKQKSNTWEYVTRTGYVSLNTEDGLAAAFSNQDKVSLYMSYGIITDPAIIEVVSSGGDSTSKAKIVQTSSGVRIWFHTYDELLGSPFPLIAGMSKEGKQIITIPG
ncbi:MAG: hypothetical protein ACE3L7_11320 [Candidatus Pristimantibacillus sp.]